MLFLLSVWEAYGRLAESVVMPPFSKVIVAWVDLVGDGSLLAGFLVSCQALVIGFVLALVIGIGLGLAMGRFEEFEDLLAPYVNAFLAMPSIAYIPVIMIWLGIGLEARVAVVFEYAVLVIAINTMTGVRTVDHSLVEMGRSFGLSQQSIFATIILPASIPAVVAGVRLGLGRSVKGMINAEMLMTLVGLGGMIKYFGSAFQTDYLLALVFSVIALALVVTGVLQRIDRRASKWKRQQQAL